MKINSMLHRIALCAAVLLGSLSSLSCNKPGAEGDGAALDVEFEVPSQMRVNSDDGCISFRIMILSKAPLKTDRILFESASASFDCEIFELGKVSFSVRIPDGMISEEYRIYVRRGEAKKLVGTCDMLIVNAPAIDIEPEDGVTIYGAVTCDGKGLENVVVSDGIEVVRTDKEGIYQMRSAKKHSYVFISVPSGYETLNDGVFPEHYFQLGKPADEAERVDFTLVRSGDQTNHTMLVFGDMHLANRTDDKKQFAEFIKDVNQYVTENTGKKIYALTLGDMSWDCYWVTNSYDLSTYVRDINAIKNLTIFHTIGNHDHDMAFAGDFDTVTKYKKTVAPTYYSFNIGKVHYVVLDDIECTNTGAGDADSRDYRRNLVKEQVDWLKKDLEHVSYDTPLVIAMHAPLYRDNGLSNLTNTSSIVSIVKSYTEVHFLTAHSHKVYNVDKLGTDNIYEHNTGAVCATWWWSAYETPGIHIGQDGAPGGYRIMEIGNTSFSWQFKPTGKSADLQFRTYDRNAIEMSTSVYVPSADDSHANTFLDYAKDFVSPSSENYVYINVWDYDPEWTVEVTEGGRSLSVEKVSVCDPLHLIAYTAKRLNKNAAASFPTEATPHMFVVKAAAADSQLEIKVTDRFRNVFKESMKRPKRFSVDNYKL